ncbi:MAG: enoyl-CoA hydratase-related protein [Halioglobus sp.]|nr:enoyl-CoA hydratase-related protein [Halioglobus sp.]
MTETILYSRTGHIGRLMLNNPQKHNSLGREQLEGIKNCLTEVASDKSVRVLIVSGAGTKTFCAGASLQELSTGRISHDAFQEMTCQLADLSIPTLCAMNGDVFGGGAELAMSCDFRIGVEGSRMRVPAAAIGLCYPIAGINHFIRCLGVRVTKRILVASEEFKASALLEIGFFDHLVSPSSLELFTNDVAEHIAGLAPLAVQSMKRIIGLEAEGFVDPDIALGLSKLCLASRDLQEGFAAKREKRTPIFTGH